ncbi:hypothetical protein FRB90_002569 [Tulasnella sp. 427]|nr:hypothetical protein FRB90_002569 [Tulasnella sp. 427]
MEPAVRQHLHSVTLRTLQAHSFNRASSLAAYTLTDVLQQYLTLLAATAKQHAEHSGRDGQGCNVWDVLAALSEVGVELDELEEFISGEALDMKPYILTTKNTGEKERSDAQEEGEEEEDVVSRRLDSLADIQTSISLGLEKDADSAISLHYGPISSSLPLSPSPSSPAPSPPPSLIPITGIHTTPPDGKFESHGKGKDRLVHSIYDPNPFSLPVSDGHIATMDLSTPPPVVPPLVLPPSPPISERGGSLPSSPDSRHSKRARHSSWNPPEHIPDFLPPFPGAFTQSSTSENAQKHQGAAALGPITTSPKQSVQPVPPARRIPLPLRPAITSKSTYTKSIKYGQSSIAGRPVDLPDQSLWDQGVPPTPGQGNGIGSLKRKDGPSSLQPLIAAYHVLQADPQPATNPSRLRVAHLLGRTAPSRYTTADSLFTISSPPPPRFAPPMPTQAVSLPPEDGTGSFKSPAPLPKLGNKVISDGIREADDLSSPWMQSNLTPLTRSLLPPHLYSKVTQLPPPPPLRPSAPGNAGASEPLEPLLYHRPSLAPWSTAVDSDEAKKRVGRKPLIRESGGKKLPDAQLFATWDWPTKNPEEPLLAKRGRLGSYPTSSFVGGFAGSAASQFGGTGGGLSAANSPNLTIRTSLGHGTPIKSPMLSSATSRGFIVPAPPLSAPGRGRAGNSTTTATMTEVQTSLAMNGSHEPGLGGGSVNGIERGRMPDVSALFRPEIMNQITNLLPSSFDQHPPTMRRALVPFSKTRLRWCGPTRSFTTSLRRQNDQQEPVFDPSSVDRPTDDVDVCIVGAGPAGLSAAIRLKQLEREKGKEIRVVVLEKGSEVGSHTLSGAVIEPRALDELLPEWQKDPSHPLKQPAADSHLRFFTSTRSFPMPHPPQMSNKGNYIVSLSQVTSWLGNIAADEYGVEVYPGFAGASLAYTEDGKAVKGVITNDVGIDKNFRQKDGFEPGMLFRAKVTLLAEGAHGSLTKGEIKKFNLRDGKDPQTYGMGVKEVWRVRDEVYRPGDILHTMGYPFDYKTYGGGWVYHMADGLVSIGLVVGLDYANPYLSPYRELQRWKHHPYFRNLLRDGERIAYGGRTLNEGGLQSIPKLHFPGGALIGCSAGFLNVPKIKGTHNAMKSGMIAGEAAYDAIASLPEESVSEDGEYVGKAVDMSSYESNMKDSWVWKELKEVRNLRPSFNTPLGIWGGMAYSGVDSLILKGRVPWTFHNRISDAHHTQPAKNFQSIEYPAFEPPLSTDLLTSLALTNTNHEENTPVHLQLPYATKGDTPEGREARRHHVEKNVGEFAGLLGRACPAGVYEYVDQEGGDGEKKIEDEGWGGKKLVINSQNCIHCKLCDIKVPTQDITWTVPEGGGGPKYSIT